MSFEPSIVHGSVTTLSPFRYWCQKVLPLVYDNSLSYYELLCKVVEYLNETMENVNNIGENTNALYNSYLELTNYVNNYFNNLDVQEEINNKLDAMAESGELATLLNNLFNKYSDYINIISPAFNLNPVTNENDIENFKAILSYAEENNMGVYIPNNFTINISENIETSVLKFISNGNIVTGDNYFTISGDATNLKPAYIYISSIDNMVLSGLKNGFIHVQSAKQMRLYANGEINNKYSLAYNTFILGVITKLELFGENSGWINENTFIKGRYEEISIKGDYQHNHNIFYNPVIESTTLNIESGRYNEFLNCRLEGENTIIFGANTADNLIEKTWYSSRLNGLSNVVPSTTGGSITDNGFNNQVITKARENAYIEEILMVNAKNAPLLNQDFTVEGNNVSVSAYKTIDSGLMQINENAVFILNCDENIRFIFTLYDENGNQITENQNFMNGTWVNSSYILDATYDDIQFYYKGSNNDATIIPKFISVAIQSRSQMTFKTASVKILKNKNF